MILETDIDQAIVQCLAETEPNAWTCIRLAAFYTIKEQLFGKAEQLPDTKAFAAAMRGYSMAAAPDTSAKDEIVSYGSKSEFGKAVQGKPAAQIWPVIDDVMSILQTLSPKIYNAAMHKIKD